MKKTSKAEPKSTPELVSRVIGKAGGWRADALTKMRNLIKEVDPDVIEELKWMGTPVWSNSGIICTGESYKAHVKLTFAKGASLKDPKRLFNSGLDGNVRRAIDIKEGETVDAAAFKALVNQAILLNRTSQKAKAAKKAPKR